MCLGDVFCFIFLVQQQHHHLLRLVRVCLFPQFLVIVWYVFFVTQCFPFFFSITIVRELVHLISVRFSRAIPIISASCARVFSPSFWLLRTWYVFLRDPLFPPFSFSIIITHELLHPI